MQYYRNVLTPKYGVQAVGSVELRGTIKAVVRDKLRKIAPDLQPEVASIPAILKEIQWSVGVPDVQPESLQLWL